MKRRVILVAVLAVLIVCCVLWNGKALEPARFTGGWYYAEDGAHYLFENGLIWPAEGEVPVPRGAYSFAKDKAVLFIAGSGGVSEVTELYLVPGSDGDMLCDRTDGTGRIWFSRNQTADDGHSRSEG